MYLSLKNYFRKGALLILLLITQLAAYSQDSITAEQSPKIGLVLSGGGAGVRYSIDTKTGPLSFDISSSNISHKVNLHFSLGYFF